MWILSILRTRPIFVLILILIAIIPIITGSIYYLDKGNESKLEEPEGLKGYAELKTKIAELSSDPSIASDAQYSRLVSKFNEIAVSKDMKYQSFLNSATFLQGLYSYTNNPKLYPIMLDFVKFAKANFPQYKENDFSYFCQDPTCAENKQPKEILEILDQIKDSEIEDRDKKSLTRDITNVGYLGKKNLDSRILSYLSISYNIRNSPQSSHSAYLSIAKKLDGYVEKKYSTRLKELGIKNL